MLSYQHIYHAGNFADVHKHAILVRLLTTLAAKPAGFQVLDTHAGRGLYDLSSEEAGRNKEFETGAACFLQDEDKLLADYLKIVRKFNPDGGLAKYPGSAMIARELMRPSDKLVCVERHPGEFAELKAAMGASPNTQLLQEDGFECLVEMMPLPGRRGLVVIDPSFEIKSEYKDLAKRLSQAWKKWPQGIFMIWYPMLEAQGHRQFLTELRRTEVKDVLVSELRLHEPPKEQFRMYGSGVAIINPPWPPATLEALTQHVASKLPIKAFADVFWLDNKQIDPETGFIQL